MNTGLLQARERARGAALAGLARCMRPAQWVKNGFVLVPLVFSAHLTDARLMMREAAAFAAFCLVASGIYLWNDCLDWKSDLEHPEKRTRPIPSGQLSAPLAAACGAALLALGVGSGLALGSSMGLLLAGYAAMNILYSLRLKHLAIVDLMSIAAGFVLRVVAGAAAIGVEASHWLLMCTFLLALFLGIAKRRQELVLLAGDSARHRKVLDDYTIGWLDQAGTVVSAATIVAYALYTVAPETQARFGTDRLIYTLPFVIYGMLRYLQLAHRGDRTGNPTGALLADKPLLVCLAGWVLACVGIIYRWA
ncbi:MAG TPA: decaprenyl-phosphate phosphoribosyltransferase [Bryobacteraceae bacterium]|nr:decaprenyl-phosphate phosphoribosyltransferase [Bryobacteraceae bacterium]